MKVEHFQKSSRTVKERNRLIHTNIILPIKLPTCLYINKLKCLMFLNDNASKWPKAKKKQEEKFYILTHRYGTKMPVARNIRKKQGQVKH